MANLDIAATERRRLDILAAAARVSARVGFDKMRLRDVADEEGVSIGTLQHYFDTRDRLGRETLAYVCAERAKGFAGAALGIDSPWERVCALLNNALDPSNLAERSLTWLELCTTAAREPSLRHKPAEVQAAWRSPLLTAITDGVARGEMRPILAPEAAADALLALIDGAEVSATISPTGSGSSYESVVTIAAHILGVAAQTPDGARPAST